MPDPIKTKTTKSTCLGLPWPILKILTYFAPAKVVALLLLTHTNIRRAWLMEAPSMAATERTVLQFSSSQSLSAKVHPLVVFNICDCYVRRLDQAERVIGTLLGSILPDGTVDVRNSYAVPHSESVDQVLHTLSPTFNFYTPYPYFFILDLDSRLDLIWITD